MRVAKRSSNTRVGGLETRERVSNSVRNLRYLVHDFLSYILDTLYNDIIVSECKREIHK